MDHSVTKHKFNVKKLCRLCAGLNERASKDKPKKCELVKNELLKYCRIDISKDYTDEIPSLLCHTCYMTLWCLSNRPITVETLSSANEKVLVANSVWCSYTETLTPEDCTL